MPTNKTTYGNDLNIVLAVTARPAEVKAAIGKRLLGCAHALARLPVPRPRPALLAECRIMERVGELLIAADASDVLPDLPGLADLVVYHQADTAGDPRGAEAVRVRGPANLGYDATSVIKRQRGGLCTDAEAVAELAARMQQVDGQAVLAAAPTGYVPDDADLKILGALVKADRTLNRYDLEDECELSLRTISDRLKRLRNAGLTYRPNGPRKGEALTPAGRALIAR